MAGGVRAWSGICSIILYKHSVPGIMRQVYMSSRVIINTRALFFKIIIWFVFHCWCFYPSCILFKCCAIINPATKERYPLIMHTCMFGGYFLLLSEFCYKGDLVDIVLAHTPTKLFFEPHWLRSRVMYSRACSIHSMVSLVLTVTISVRSLQTFCDLFPLLYLYFCCTYVIA